MLTIREVLQTETKYGPISDVIVVGPKEQLQELAEMYHKPMSREFWGVPRSQWSWEHDDSLRLGFDGSESEARDAVNDAIKILGFPRPNPLPANQWFVIRFEGDTYAARHLQEALDLANVYEGDMADVEYAVVKAKDAGAARLTPPKRWRPVSNLRRSRDPEFEEEPRDNPAKKLKRKNPVVAWRCSHCDYEGTGEPPKVCPRCKR